MLITSIREEEAHIKAIVLRSNSSFYWAMRLLPREKRTAMFAIYAFCRGVDDIADELGATQCKRAHLEKRRTEIVAAFDGSPNNLLDRQLLLAKNRFKLRSIDFLDIIEGVTMDLSDGKVDEQVRITTLDELTLYCDRVAGAVGRLSNRVFGLVGERSDRLASSLGRALQITNILRDLLEDAESNRLYLPQETLKKHGIKNSEPKDVLTSPLLANVCNEIATIAKQDFKDAESILSKLERNKTRPIIIMKAIYQPTLQRLVKRGWVDLGQSVRLSRPEKIWIILRSGYLGR
jgi:phytoene synthase